MEVARTYSDIISLAALIAALLALVGYYNKIFLWVQKRDRAEAEMKAMKEEQRVLCVALSACLDGLIQLGANHEVPKAKKELDNYIRSQAHK